MSHDLNANKLLLTNSSRLLLVKHRIHTARDQTASLSMTYVRTLASVSL